VAPPELVGLRFGRFALAKISPSSLTSPAGLSNGLSTDAPAASAARRVQVIKRLRAASKEFVALHPSAPSAAGIDTQFLSF